MSKILRLWKQQRLLDNYKKEIISRGLETLEELEKAKAAEKGELEHQEAAAISLAKAVDFLANPVMDPASLSDSFQEGLGFSGGTPQVTLGS